MQIFLTENKHHLDLKIFLTREDRQNKNNHFYYKGEDVIKRIKNFKSNNFSFNIEIQVEE